MRTPAIAGGPGQALPEYALHIHDWLLRHQQFIALQAAAVSGPARSHARTEPFPRRSRRPATQSATNRWQPGEGSGNNQANVHLESEFHVRQSILLFVASVKMRTAELSAARVC
jgi:hypothetical protein